MVELGLDDISRMQAAIMGARMEMIIAPERLRLLGDATLSAAKRSVRALACDGFGYAAAFDPGAAAYLHHQHDQQPEQPPTSEA